MMLSCSGTQCPGFPNALIDYTPHYPEGEMIFFANTSDDTMNWTCRNKWIATPSYLEWNNTCCGCSSRIAGQAFLSDQNVMMKIMICLESHAFDDYDPGINNLLNSSISLERMDSNTGPQYLHCRTSPTFVNTDEQDVQITDQVDTLLFTAENAQIIDSVCIVRGQGIVSFYRVDNMSRYHVLR